MTNLELIMHLAEGSTTANTLPHIAKLARQELEHQRLTPEQVWQAFKNLEDIPDALYAQVKHFLKGRHDQSFV